MTQTCCWGLQVGGCERDSPAALSAASAADGGAAVSPAGSCPFRCAGASSLPSSRTEPCSQPEPHMPSSPEFCPQGSSPDGADWLWGCRQGSSSGPTSSASGGAAPPDCMEEIRDKKTSGLCAHGLTRLQLQLPAAGPLPCPAFWSMDPGGPAPAHRGQALPQPPVKAPAPHGPAGEVNGFA